MTQENFSFENIKHFITEAMVALGVPKNDSALIGDLMAKAD